MNYATRLVGHLLRKDHRMNVNLAGPPHPRSYGFAVGPTTYGPLGIISGPEISAAGNIVLHVGHENPDGRGWTKTEHVVLTPEEARDLIGDMLHLLNRDALARKAHEAGTP